jgi:hypothetical protein
MLKILRKIQGVGWWEVRKCGFPYPSGYATYNKTKNMILDTGLTKDVAQSICDIMNYNKETK